MKIIMVWFLQKVPLRWCFHHELTHSIRFSVFELPPFQGQNIHCVLWAGIGIHLFFHSPYLRAGDEEQRAAGNIRQIKDERLWRENLVSDWGQWAKDTIIQLG